MDKVKVKVIDSKISKRQLSGVGGKPLTGVVEFEEKEAKRLVSIGVVELVDEDGSTTSKGEDEGNTTGSNSDDVNLNSFEEVVSGFEDGVREIGVNTLEELAATEQSVLETVKGIGPKTAEELISKATELTKA